MIGISAYAMGIVILASVVAATDSARAGAPPVLYLERCAGGYTLTSGVDDSRLNRSSLTSGTSYVAGFAYLSLRSSLRGCRR